MRDEAEKSIGHFYPPIEVTAEMAKGRPDLKPYVGQKLTVIAWLWARTVKSPTPALPRILRTLAGQAGAEVSVTLEIEARLPNGASEQMVRAVTENSRTLKFASHAFEKD